MIIPKANFSSGELAPPYQMRVDTELGQAGLSRARNVVYIPGDGMSKRPGTTIAADTGLSQKSCKGIPFAVSANQDYMLDFGNKTLRFVKNGSYVTDSTLTIQYVETASMPSGGGNYWVLYTVGNHGWEPGQTIVFKNLAMSGNDEVSALNDIAFETVAAYDNVLTLYPRKSISTSIVSPMAASGTVSRVYTISTPYDVGDLPNLQYSQPPDPGNVMYLTDGSHAPQLLTRVKDTSWSISADTFSPSQTAPSTLTGTPLSGGTVRMYCVTAVGEGGKESLVSNTYGVAATPTAVAPETLSWAASTGAKFYNVYATDSDTSATEPNTYGLIGRSFNASFVDAGIDPDYSITPPKAYNPFTIAAKSLDLSADFTPNPDGAVCVAYSPDGLTVAFGCSSAPWLHVYHRVTRESPWIEVAVDYSVVSQQLYNQDPYGASVPTSMTWKSTYIPINSIVNDLAFSPDGKWLAVAGSFTGTEIGNQTLDGYTIPSTIYSNYGRLFCVQKTTTGISVGPVSASTLSYGEGSYDAGSHWAFFAQRMTFDGVCYGVAWSPNGSQLTFAGSFTNGLKVFTWAPGAQALRVNFDYYYYSWAAVTTFISEYPANTPLALKYTSDGGKLVVAHRSTNAKAIHIKIYNIDRTYNALAGQPDTQMSDGGSTIVTLPVGLSIRPGNDAIVLTCRQTGAFAWWSITGDTIAKLTDPSGIPAVGLYNNAWSPDGTYLAVFHTVSSSSGVKLYKYSSGPAALAAYSLPSESAALPAVTVYDGTWSDNGKDFILCSDGDVAVYSYKDVQKYPLCVTHLQQRTAYGCTEFAQSGVWMSAVGDLSNHSERAVLQPSDAFYFKFSDAKAAMRRLRSLGPYLVSLNSGGEMTVSWASGSPAANEIPDTKTQSCYGCSDVQPVILGDSIIYVAAGGREVRELRYSDSVSGYTGTCLSEYAAHLFKGRYVTDMVLQRLPDPILWLTMSDGCFLSFTFRRDEARAWCEHDTDGSVQGMCVCREGLEDRVYMYVDREVCGTSRRYIERMDSRLVTDCKTDQAFLDCSKVVDGYNASQYRVLVNQRTAGDSWAAGVELAITSFDGLFTSDDVGSDLVFESTSGKTMRLTVSSVANIGAGVTAAYGTADIEVPTDLQNANTSDWSYTSDEVTGLSHLEGKDVAVFADGFVVANPDNPKFSTATVLTVANGKVTLPKAYTYIRVGLPIWSVIGTLAVNSFENPAVAERYKNIDRATISVVNSKGFFTCTEEPEEDTVAEMAAKKCQASEGDAKMDSAASILATSTPDEPFTGQVTSKLSTTYNKHGRVFIVHNDPTALCVSAINVAGLI